MSTLALLRRRPKEPKPESVREPHTPKTMLRTAGRWVLWTALIVVLLRGLDATFSSDPEPVAPAPAAEGADQRAAGTEAFAEQYARAYLTSTGDLDADRDRVARFTPADAETGVQPPEAKPKHPVTVASTAVVDVEQLDGQSHVTVAAVTSEGVRQLVVPVTRDSAGGLAVLEPARPAPAARLAGTDPPEHGSLPGAVRSSVTPTLEQSLRAYLSGDTDALRFLTAPGATIHPATGYELDNIGSVLERAKATRAQRFLSVTATATDEDGTRHTFQFAVTVQYANDRWLLERIQ